MASIREDLDSFHAFAAGRLAGGASPDSLEELLVEWYDRRDRRSINDSIRRGLKEVEEGRFESAERLTEKLRHEFGAVEE